MSETESPNRTIVYIGTHKLAAFEVSLEGREPSVLRSYVITDPEGFEKGFVTNLQKASETVEKALKNLCEPGKVRPEDQPCYVVLGNSKLKMYTYTSSIYYQGVQRTIGPEEISQVIRQTKTVATLPLSEIILQAIPQCYIVNDMDGVRNPVGLEAHRLGVYLKMHTMPFEDFKNITKIFETLDIEVSAFFPKSVAVSEAVLADTERAEGALVIDIADGAVHMSLWKESNLVAVQTIPGAGQALTQAIASVWNIEAHDARKIKEKYGTFESPAYGDELIPIVDRKSDGHHQVKRQEFQENFLAQGKDWLEKILKQADQFAKENKVHHPHYIYTGGSVVLQGFLEFLQKNFSRSGRIGLARQIDAPNQLMVDPAMTAPLGMMRWLSAYEREQRQYFAAQGFLKKTLASAKDWFTAYF